MGNCGLGPEGVTCKVTQSPVLGPSLFLLLINELAQEHVNACFLFAVDVMRAGEDILHDLEAVKVGQPYGI